MSNERDGGKGGFGPKKPKATFGDVMLGIRAGQGGEAHGPPRGGDRERAPRRNERPGRREKAPSSEPEQQARPEIAEVAARPPRKRSGRKDEKPRGPLVVIKRASGVVETRHVGEPVPGSAAAPESAVAEAAPAAEPSEAPARVDETAAQGLAPEPPTPSSALYEEVPESQSFAELLEASKQQVPSGRRAVRLGDHVSGPILQLGADSAFVQIGGKSEAVIDLRELQDEEGILRFGVGDLVEAYVVEVGAKGILLSRALPKGAASMSMLASARETGLPVEGKVTGVNKGGLEVMVGDVRAFCPVSQVDLRFVENLEQFVGQKLKFRVTEVRERKVVLSRRALLEEVQKVLAEQTRKQLEVGKVVKGKVSGVRDFGAFVDLGGVEGLIPLSELAHGHVGHPREVVSAGNEVEVEVIRMEPADPNSPDKAKHKERITLSLRSRQADPWVEAVAEIHEGDRLKGKVARLQPFGAFVELRAGVDGLIHVSALSDRRVAHPKDVVSVGEEVWVEVEKVDPTERRIGLRRITEEEAAIPPEARPVKEKAGPVRAGQVVTGKVERVEAYGIFLGFPGGRGLVPASETGTERRTDLRKHFPLGGEHKAEVLEVDGTGRIRLSIAKAASSEERAEAREWMRTQTKPSGKKGLGTFADLLKGKKLL